MKKRAAVKKISPQLRRSLPYLALLIPGALYFLFFKYAPIWGVLISFKNYKPIYSFAESPWVGLANYIEFFTGKDFGRLLGNTMIIALNNILFYFPIPILVALMLHEVPGKRFQRTVQSVIYIPHFISWVVIAVISNSILGDRGLINTALQFFGQEPERFLYSNGWFRLVILAQMIWKECGWGTIIFIAALTAINPELYEAATIDGAGRFQRIWYVTLPSIKSIIIVMFILRVGRFLDTGFEQIFLMLNSMNRDIGEVFDTYIYDTGILQGRFSYTMAISVFKSAVGFALVLITDRVAKWFGEEGIL